MAQDPLHIALPWHGFGHVNLGCDALTRANVAIIEAAATAIDRSVRFTTLCSPAPFARAPLPANVRIGPMPQLKPLLKGRSEYLDVLRDSDLVVDIGEGDSWADIYGGKRFAFQAGTKLAALMLGKPLVLSPQTIGPFANRLYRRAANHIMDHARAIFARDNLSMDYLRDNRIRGMTDEYIDVAFRLPFIARPKATDGRVRVGMNVSGLLYQGGYSGKNEFNLMLDYRELTHRLITAFDRMPGVEVHLIPHVIGSAGEPDSDLSVVPELVAAFPKLIVPPTFDGASEAKSYMSGLDFIVGGRMHACIGAFSSGVAVVPVAYSRKFNGLFDTLGYPHLVDGRTMSTDQAFDAIMAGFANRDALAGALAPGLNLAEDRLNAYQKQITDIMTSL